MNEGDGFAIHIWRQVLYAPPPTDQLAVATNDAANVVQDVDEPHGPVLLQLQTLISYESDGMALLSQDNPDVQVPVRLEGLGSLKAQLPSFITVASSVTRESIRSELAAFGHDCNFELAANHTFAVCFPFDWTWEPDKLLILFTDMQQEIPCADSTFLTLTEQADLTELRLMSLLHQFGFEKGVILRTKHISTSFLEVQYVQPLGIIDHPCEAISSTATLAFAQPTVLWQ